MVQSQDPGPNGTTTADDESPLGPEESLALIERESSRIHKRLMTSPVPFLLCWGFVYLLGFGGLYLAYGPRLFPETVVGIVFAVLIVAGIVFSAVYGIRCGRGVRGGSQTTGAMYGISWPLAFFALTGVNIGLQQRFGLADNQVTLLWSTSAMILVGAMYLVSAAMWRSSTMYAFGVIVLAGAVVCVLVGAPASYLVVAVAIGGGMLLMAAVWLLRSRRRA
jgi:hypothetical protein